MVVVVVVVVAVVVVVGWGLGGGERKGECKLGLLWVERQSGLHIGEVG